MGRRAFLALLLFPALLKARPPMPVGEPIRPPKPVGPPLKFADGYDPDHTCDRCGHTSARGSGNWIVRSESGDRHTHRCENCGNTWWHFDDGHVPEAAPTITLPASGCANGNCPAPSRTVTRWRLFR